MKCRKGNWRTYRAAGLAPLLAKFEVGEGYATSDYSPSFIHVLSFCTRALILLRMPIAHACKLSSPQQA